MKKRIVSILFAVFISLATFTWTIAADATARTVSIFKIEGTDAKMTKGTEKEFTAKAGIKLFSGYTVSTGADSYAYLKLDEDSLIKMDQKSKVKVNKQTSKKLSVSVLSGGLAVDAATQTGGNTMEIRAGSSSLAIRGTYFVAEITPTGTKFTMFEGFGVMDDGTEVPHGKMLIITEEEDGTQTQELVDIEITGDESAFLLQNIIDNAELLLGSGILTQDDLDKVQELLDNMPADTAVPELAGVGVTAGGQRYYSTETPSDGGYAPPSTAQQDNAEAQDNADITAAKTSIEGASYTAAQINTLTIAQAKAAVEAIIGGLSLNGVTTTVVNGAFTKASSATSGNYGFTVTLNKGMGTGQTTTSLTLTIPFDGETELNGSYDTLANALAAATTGQTVNLISDAEINTSTMLTTDFTLIVNNGVTLTVSDTFWLVAGAEVINNGTINTGHPGWNNSFDTRGGTITNNGTINITAGIHLYNSGGTVINSASGIINLMGGNLSNNMAGIFTNSGTITIDGDLNSQLRNSNNFTNNGTITFTAANTITNDGGEFDSIFGTITGVPGSTIVIAYGDVVFAGNTYISPMTLTWNGTNWVYV